MITPRFKVELVDRQSNKAVAFGLLSDAKTWAHEWAGYAEKSAVVKDESTGKVLHVARN